MAKGQASPRSLRAGRRLQSPELLEVRAAPGAGIAGLMVGAAWFGFGDRPSEGFASGPDGQAPLTGLLGATCLSDRPLRVPRTIVQPEAPRSEPLSSLAAVQRSPGDPRHRDRGRSRAGQLERIVAGRLLQWDVFSLAPSVRSVAVRRCVQSSARPRHNGRHLARARGRRFGDSRVGRRAREPTGRADSTGRSRARHDPPLASGAPAKSPPQPGPRRLRRHVRRQRRLGRLWWREP